MGVMAGGMALTRALPVEAAQSPKVQETLLTMGTVVSVSAYAPSQDQAREAIGRAFEEMDRLIAVFDRHRSATAISVLNDQGRLDGAPAELTAVLTRAGEISRLSGGAFDVSVAPVVDLLKSSHGKPSKAQFSEALELVNARGVQINGQNLRLDRGGMRLTLDGIAKGYIADRMTRVLIDNGVSACLVNAGGDIRAHGQPASNRPWRVAIEDPNKQSHYPDILDIANGAVATSGSYEVFFDPARKTHHLVNPGSGHSPQGIVSVSVQAPSVMEADALATTLSLLTPSQALDLVETLPRRECLLVAETGAKLSSRGWGRVHI